MFPLIGIALVMVSLTAIEVSKRVRMVVMVVIVMMVMTVVMVIVVMMVRRGAIFKHMSLIHTIPNICLCYPCWPSQQLYEAGAYVRHFENE